jgi:hypothetical protein
MIFDPLTRSKSFIHSKKIVEQNPVIPNYLFAVWCSTTSGIENSDLHSGKLLNRILVIIIHLSGDLRLCYDVTTV